ncbi:MAG: hypothetical protein AAF497_02695 [Planctomycetota bacterium]
MKLFDKAIRLVPTFIFAIAIAVSPANVNAEDALVMELRAMAKDHVLPLVEKRGGGAIAVGGFTPATSVKGGAGPEVQLKLSEILQQLNAKINADDYRFEITGNYLPYDDRDSGLQGVKLVGRLVDAEDGTTLGEFPRFVFGPEAVPRLLGLSVSTKGSNDAQTQSNAFRKALKSPKPFFVGNNISATPVSEYAVEVLTLNGRQYHPCRVSQDNKSRPFVHIEKNSVYAVRLVNHSNREAAVKLTIDGVNAFQFSQQTPRPQYWIVPPKKNGKPGVTVVRGWDKSDSRSIEFKVVDFPHSAAARVNLQPSPGIGLITATFSACWEYERDRPRSEGRTRATGFGKEIVDRKTRVKRHIGRVRDVVSIRYERPQVTTGPFVTSR